MNIETRLIDDLLELSAVSTCKLNLSFEAVDMNRLVENVAEMLRRTWPPRICS